jgi:hypothetical protein
MSLLTTIIRLIAPSLPAGYCITTPQQFANDLFESASAQFQSSVGNSFFNTGSGPISADNQIFPWFDSQGLWWFFGNGTWQRPHAVPAGGSERRLWMGSPTDLQTYDGGSATVSNPANSGPMWEIDTTFAARFPVGVGSFPSGAVVAVGTTAGDELTTLTTLNLPPHSHDYTSFRRDSVQLYGSTIVTLDVFNEVSGPALNGPIYTSSSVGGAGSPAAAVPFVNTPPYVGVYFIKRTARVYYTRT